MRVRNEDYILKKLSNFTFAPFYELLLPKGLPPDQAIKADKFSKKTTLFDLNS